MFQGTKHFTLHFFKLNHLTLFSFILDHFKFRYWLANRPKLTKLPEIVLEGPFLGLINALFQRQKLCHGLNDTFGRPLRLTDVVGIFPGVIGIGIGRAKSPAEPDL